MNLKMISAEEARELTAKGKMTTLEPLVEIVNKEIQEAVAIGRECVVLHSLFNGCYYLQDNFISYAKSLGYVVTTGNSSSGNTHFIRLDW